MEKLILIIVGILVPCSITWAGQLKLTSYYPAPNLKGDRGSFNRLTFNPIAPSPGNPECIGNDGLTYFDSFLGTLRTCSGGVWTTTPGVFKQNNNKITTADAAAHSFAVGTQNLADLGDYSAIFGESNVAAGNNSFLGGGAGHNISATATYSAMIGGYWNILNDAYASGIVAGNGNIVNGDFNVIAGGSGNQIILPLNDADNSFIGGGGQNLINGVSAAIIGGGGNVIDATASNAAIAGGGNNTASGVYSFIGGGHSNQASGSHSLVGGGSGNEASGNYSFVGGGSINTLPNPDVPNKASGENSAVIGGQGNTASNLNAVVVGGLANKASGTHSAAIGGNGNTASGASSVVIGGSGKSATGANAISLGGNAVGDNSFAVCGRTNSANSIAIGCDSYFNGTTNDYSAVVGGYETGMQNSQQSFIGGGYTVSIEGGVRNGTIGGWGMGMRDASMSGILAGETNFIQESNWQGVPAKPYASAIVAGATNWIEGNRTVIIGGSGNQVEGDNTIVGGQGMTVGAAADNTFVFGRDTAGAVAPIVTTPDAAIFFPGNINGKLSVNEKAPQADLHVSHTGGGPAVVFIDSETIGTGGQLYIRNIGGSGCTLIEANHGVLALTDTLCPGED